MGTERIEIDGHLQNRRTELNSKLTDQSPKGLYLCDRGERLDIVVYWSGHSLHMANFHTGGAVRMEYFSNFRKLVEEKAKG